MKNKQFITKFIMIFASQLILILIYTNNIRYATNDDTTMLSLSGGGYITPSEYLANIHFHKLWNLGINYKKICVLGCTVLALISISLLKDNLSNYNACYSNERKKVLNYLEKNEDKLFLAGDSAVFSLGVAYNIFENPGYKHKWNLIGNWEMYTVPSNNLIHSYNYNYNYKNIAYEAVNNENILILTSRDDIFTQWGNYILDLYEEHYGMRPEYKKVTDLTTNILINEEYEYWAVYKLVLTKGVK